MTDQADAKIPVKGKLENADWLVTQETGNVFNALNREGFEARVVGGAIRNTILGKTVKDIDLATTADPETSSRLALAAGLKVIPTGLHHGTITVVSGGIPYEVTTLRRDVETDGRRAKVAFTNCWMEDASRRDFTMNALYVDSEGTIYDPLNGYDDLLAKRVRFIGNPVDRIREDYLRILRYFRFKAEYGLDTLDNASLQACIREKDGLRLLSAERISAEILRLLAAPAALHVIRTMFRYGLIVELLGSVANPDCLEKLIRIENTVGSRAGALMRLASLALYVSEDAGRITERFRLSNRDRMILEKMLTLTPVLFRDMSHLQAKEALYRLGQTDYQNRVLFCWSRSRYPETDSGWKKIFTLPCNWQVPAFPLGGRDLATIGFCAGPVIGETLRKLEQYWIESDFSLNREKLLEMARSFVGAV